ncbi:MAG: putative rane protein [Ramlibacter sp.]|nr:putative rane protein [Ramlibacter sp.]
MNRASQLPGHAATSDATALREQRDRRQARTQGVAARAAAPQPQAGAALQRALGAGRPLAPQDRAEMEERFGTGFADVRVHDTAQARQLAREQRAQAFTIGNHIAFGRPPAATQASHSRRLLAHELAHVVQQRRGGTKLPVAGGALEQSAQRAASQFVSGSGLVSVPGASATAIAREPLPDKEAAVDLPPAPRSLSGSVAKDEKHLPGKALDLEMTHIEQYADALPEGPQREHLLSEYRLLFDERIARRKRDESAVPLQFRPDDVKRDIEDAHRALLVTGQIPQTQYPHSLAEIKLGKPMSRSERYDLMMKLQGREHPLEMDVRQDLRDPEILDKEEFEREYRSRIEDEKDACDDEYFWPKYERECKEGVNEKYGGPAYIGWRDDKYRRAYAQFVEVSAKIDAVRQGGPVSLVGRVAGYGFGALTGRDPLETSEVWANWASAGDALLPAVQIRATRAQIRNYNAGAGLVVHADAPIGEVYQPAGGSPPTPVRVAAQPTGATGMSSTLAPPIPDPLRLATQPLATTVEPQRSTVTGPSAQSTQSAPTVSASIESRLGALQVPARQQGSFAQAGAEVRKLAEKDPAAAERLLQGLEERFAPAPEVHGVADLFQQAQGKMFPEKGLGNVYRQSPASDDRQRLDQRDPSPKDVLKAKVRDSEQLGVLGGREQAQREKIAVRDWERPQQYTGEYGVGPDDLGDRGNKRLFLEYKGGDSGLGSSNGVVQLSNVWAGRKIAEMEMVGDKATAADLLAAARRGDLQAVAYRTSGPIGAETTARLSGSQLRNSLKNENISASGLIQYAPEKVLRAYQARKAELQKAIAAGQIDKLKTL